VSWTADMLSIRPLVQGEGEGEVEVWWAGLDIRSGVTALSKRGRVSKMRKRSAGATAQRLGIT
jgi:hypothetical protein